MATGSSSPSPTLCQGCAGPGKECGSAAVLNLSFSSSGVTGLWLAPSVSGPQAVLSGTIVPPTGSSSSPPQSLFFILGFRPEQVPTVLKAAEAGVLPTLPSSQWACLRGGPKTQAFLSSRPHPPAVLAVPVERGKALAVSSLDLLPSVPGTKDSGLRPQSSGLWLPEFRDLTSVAVMGVGVQRETHLDSCPKSASHGPSPPLKYAPYVSDSRGNETQLSFNGLRHQKGWGDTTGDCHLPTAILCGESPYI